MEKLIDKISSYHLFNYLLPGILFAAIGERVTAYKLIQSDIVVGVFVYYFFGLVISRIGSIFVEPIFRKVKFVKFASYTDFVAACARDPKIEMLSEANNTYRTLCALFVVLILLKLFEILGRHWSGIEQVAPYGLLAFLLALFAFAHRKQTSFITRRIQGGK